MFRIASTFKKTKAIEKSPALQDDAMADDKTRSRYRKRIVARSRDAAVVIVSMQVFMASGCTNLPSPFGQRETCCADGQVGCLPIDASEVPPAASINHTYRCVEPMPEDAVPAPIGTYMGQWRGAMSDGAQKQNWIVTRNEWFDGGSQLGPKGQQHVQRIAHCLVTYPQLVVIENEPVALALGDSYEEAVRANQQLQIKRRNVVVEALAEAGVPDAPQWVVFADDRSVGVRGVEAPLIYNSQFSGTGTGNRGGIGQGQGSGFGGGSGISGGGFGSGGFGGGGIF